MKNNNLSNRILNMKFMKKSKETIDKDDEIDNILNNKFDLKLDDLLDKTALTNSKLFMEKPKALLEKLMKNSRSKIIKKTQQNVEVEKEQENTIDNNDKKHNNHQYMKFRKGKK